METGYPASTASTAHTNAASPPDAPPPLVTVFPVKWIEFLIDHNDVTSSEHIVIQSIWNAPVYFKIKTTTPRLYTVKPTSGVLQPNEKALVRIGLQAHAPGTFGDIPVVTMKDGTKVMYSYDRFQVLSYEALNPHNSIEISPTNSRLPGNVNESSSRAVKLSVAFIRQDSEGQLKNDKDTRRVEGSAADIDTHSDKGTIKSMESTKSNQGMRGMTRHPAHTPNETTMPRGNATANGVAAPPGVINRNKAAQNFSRMIPSSYEDLKAQYEQTVQYSLAIEKQLNLAEAEKEARRVELELLTEKSGNSSGMRFLLYCIGAMMLVYFFFSKLFLC